MKKNLSFYCLLFCGLLAGCGQTGPLYLPDAPPPIHVEPESGPETDPEVEPEPEPEPEQNLE